MEISEAGLKLIEGFEGLRLSKYKDSAGYPTIGYGHLIRHGEHFPGPLTQQQAEDLFKQDVQWAVDTVNKAVSAGATQHQFDAMVSLCFNIGARAFAGSSVVRSMIHGTVRGAADAFLMWKNAGGRPILLGRRQKEREYFLMADNSGV